jgi:L-threonylcarbamoyladenylate synthase
MSGTATRLLDPAVPEAIAEAAAILRGGGLVAFPTETVYGLGANALDPAAVARIFDAKGRPATNPIIVHVASVADLEALTQSRSPFVDKIAERFWPGPLTLVLPKTAAVPNIVTAGGPTVAVRVPAHPVALALLRAAGLPVAAPSANRSTELSPTTAEHVARGLGGRIDLILDGGPTTGGIESTVLDLTADPPRILRPGLVTPAMIEAVIGPIQRFGDAVADGSGSVVRSPGMMAKHYAPRAALELADDDDGRRRVEGLTPGGERVGWLTWPGAADVPGAVRIDMPAQPAGYAARLYAALHDLDAAGVDRIVVAAVPGGDDWIAIRDRLRRAGAN